MYAVALHGRHTHLTYALELPEQPGEVQQALGIARRANPFLGVVNPVFEALEGVESPQVELPRYPHHLARVFGDRRFHSADPVGLLDYPGTEILIAMLEGPRGGEMGLDLRPEHEDEHTAEIFRLLKIRREESPMDPIFAGKWA